MLCKVHAVDGDIWSGLDVTTIIKSKSSLFTLEFSKVLIAAW